MRANNNNNNNDNNKYCKKFLLLLLNVHFFPLNLYLGHLFSRSTIVCYVRLHFSTLLLYYLLHTSYIQEPTKPHCPVKIQFF